MSKFKNLFFILFVLIFTTANAQTDHSIITSERESTYGTSNDVSLPLWVRKMYEKDPNVFEVEKLYNEYYKQNVFVKSQHTQYYKRWKKNVAPFVNELGFIRPPSKTFFDSVQNEFLTRKANMAAAKSGVANWACIGPFDFDKDAGGRSHAPGAAHVYTLERAPSNADILYCGTATAGVWKTTDRGVNWVCMTKNLPFGYCNAVEIHPTDPNIVWIGANNRIYKTTDGGSTWTTVGDANFNALSHSIDDLALQPNNPNVLFVCSNKGLYRSTDAGANFVRVIATRSSDGYFSEIEFKPNDPNTIYVIQSGVSDKYTEFYKSIDGGLTFSLVNNWPVIASASSATYQHITRLGANNGHVSFANDNLGTATTPDFTIEMRVRVPTAIYDKAILSNKNWASGNNNGWVIGGRFNGNLTFNAGTGSSRIDLNTGGIWDNQWHTIALVYRASGSKELYKDGVLAASTTTAMTMTNTNLPMILGKDGNLAYGGFDIDVDEIRIWNTPLSSANIATWHNTAITNSHPNYANLLHFYKCTNTTNNILTDEQNTNNGTISGTISSNISQTFSTTTNLGSNDHQKRAEISVTPAKPNRVYALLSGKINGGEGLFGVYVSDDAGETWTHKCCGSGAGGAATAAAGGITTPATNANMLGYSETGNEEGGQYYYDLAMDADPTNGDKVHIAGINHWYSVDGGTTFNLTAKWSWPGDPEYIHADIHGIHIYGNEVWVNCDGGIFMSTDSGKTNFNKRQYGIAGTDFWGFGIGHKDGDVMLGGTYHNSHLMKNGNVYINDWVSYTGSADGTRGFVNPVKNKQVYNDSRRDLLPDVRTQSPTEFTLSKLPNTDPESKIIWDPRCYNCIYTGKDSDLWYSEDDGVTWVLVKNFGTMKVGDIEIGWDDPNIIWVTTAAGFYDPKKIWKSTDKGATWTDVTPSSATLGFESSLWFDISLGDNSQDVWLATKHNYGWYSTNAHKIFYSNNGGTTWVDWTTPLIANEAVNQIVYQRGTNGGIYLGSRKSVYYRNKTMTDWVQFDNGLPAATSCVRLFPWYKEGKIRNATNRSVWESPLYEIGQPVAQPMVNKFTANCSRDTFYFGDYSAHHKSGATFSWTFSPTPQYVSSTTVENPKVVFGAVGSYSVSLTVTDNYGTSTKTINNMITVNSFCNPDTLPIKALRTAANGDYFSIENAKLTNLTHFTVTGWWKPNGTQQAYAALFSSGDWCAHCDDTEGLIFDYNGSKLWYKWPGNGSVWASNSGIDIPLNEWSYVALVITPTGATLYLNEKKMVDNRALSPGDITNLYIGYGHYSKSFKGDIDEVTMWRRALSEDEIRRLRHLTKKDIIATDTDLIGYWQFNELVSGAMMDKAKSLHGTLTAGATLANSTAPIGGGVSAKITVNAGGIKDFTNTDCQMEFPASGIYPNGDIVVTKLNIAPDQNPSGGTPLSNPYWIVNNYGTNQAFTALNNLKFNNLGSFGTGTASDFKLYQRNANAEGATWGTNIDGADNLASNNLTFTPPITCMGITSFGQFTINKDASTAAPSASQAECNVSTVIGRAMSNSSNGDYLQTPSINLNKNDGNNNNEITIMAWVRPVAATQSSYAAIVSCASGVVVNLNLRDNNELGLHWNDGYWSWSTGLTLPANQWSHVALVATATNLKIYLNGVAATNTTAVTAINLANRQWIIGRDRSNSSRTFKGLIDEVCFYNRALSQDELREKMHLIKDPTTDASLKGYFQFNETNAVIWNKTDGNFAAFSGSATRATSTAPVATGTSQRMSVTTSGVKDFASQNLSIEFPNSGTLPNGEIVVSALTAAPDQNPTIGTPLSNRYWVINNYGTNSTFTALNNLIFNNLGSFATGATANFKLYKRTSTADGATWGTALATATNMVANNSVSFGSGNNITSFSQFALMNETVLSAEILDFQAILQDNKTALTWKIGDDKDVNYYVIERSFDGKTFETLKQVAKNQRFTYDDTPQYGINYYRLKVVEYSGKTTFSTIKSVNIENTKFITYKVFPNPTADNLNIQFQCNEEQTVDFELINTLGQMVYQYSLNSRIGDNHLFFRTTIFPKGQYLLKIKYKNIVKVEKIIIE